MENPQQTQDGSGENAQPIGSVPSRFEEFRSVPNSAEAFRMFPKDSESFRTVPNPSESFGNVPHASEAFSAMRKESHTMTVREAARMFEQAGVARTERSIVNWCQPNATGIARLDAYFDPNERRYYITQQSIESAIAEEKAKAFRNGQDGSEAVPNRSEEPKQNGQRRGEASPKENAFADVRSLEKELLDLKILNSGKDFYIQRLTQERDGFIKQMIDGSKKIGELETRLLQIEGPAERGKRNRDDNSHNVPNTSESFGI